MGNLFLEKGYNKKSELGQFMTPQAVARFMASLFEPLPNVSECRLLDAGAGKGALTCAFLDRCAKGDLNFSSINVTSYEIDEEMRRSLLHNLSIYRGISERNILGDYIIDSAYKSEKNKYTHIILNPPYKKISSQSLHKAALRHMGIESVNLYSAFVALALLQSAPNGQIVAIIPRSFCNGSYYHPFREFILQKAAIKRIHLFESRSRIFEDDILQENVIIYLQSGIRQGNVTVSVSRDASFNDILSSSYSFEDIVYPSDIQNFIHIPTQEKPKLSDIYPNIRYSLEEIGLNVSTGPVVDFRVKPYLKDMPQENCVPLIYPKHLTGDIATWPILNFKKANALLCSEDTKRLLYPNGFYCAVRRFSAKEEKKRLVAKVINPEDFGNPAQFAFENHLNIFHEQKRGIEKTLAYGLSCFLSATALDEYFRSFSGHTQVNVTDLKMLKYPSRDDLMKLGKWAMQKSNLSQAEIDARIGL